MTVAASADAGDKELLCGTDLQCIDGVCSKPENKARRLVIVITAGRRRDRIELGTYDSVFTSKAVFDVAKHHQDPATGDDLYVWETEGGKPASLRIATASPSTPTTMPSDDAFQQRAFAYERQVSIDGRKAQAKSSGYCFDPTNVTLGWSLVPGIIYSDEEKRYYSLPANRKGLIAHCTDKTSGEDFWLHTDSDGLACFNPSGSDALTCFVRTKTPSGERFTFDGGSGEHIDIDRNGHFESASMIPATSEPITEGTCDIGPAFAGGN